MSAESPHPAEVAKAYAFLDSGLARTIRGELSLAMIAARLGVEESTVLRWERAERRPRAANAVAYVALLRELVGARRD